MKTLSLTLLFFYLFLHQKAFTEMKRIKHGKELNKVLGLTARNMFVFGLLATIGILLIKL
ncbi:hypothetical protein HMPREF9296_1610 [Prevotella disiens FB035-09AN]|nr:hypothetical protein HMPREF9296_1610 [Prevotella disiens FB035-09AN]